MSDNTTSLSAETPSGSGSPWNLGRQVFGRPEDKGRVPSREEAQAILDEWVTNPKLQLHMRQVGALLGAWARQRLNLPEDQAHLWEMAGLLHDADWDQFPDQHCRKIIERLEAAHYDPELIHAIASHGPRHFGVTPVSELDKMIFAFDELSGFVHAVSLMRPNGYQDMEPKSVKKKLKDKSFAAQVDRQDISEGVELSGLELDELIRFVIEAQAGVS